MKIKKITKDFSTEHTWDMEIPETHNYVIEDTIICHNTSATQNVTNGVEPVRALLSYKSSKKASIPFLVPNVKTHADYYELAFDMPDNTGYMNICAVIQKWQDMAMSINQYYNPLNYEDKKIPYSQIIKDMMYFYKLGGKCLYYLNTDDGNTHFEKSSCSAGGCTL